MAFNLNKNDGSNLELDPSKKSNSSSKFDLSKNDTNVSEAENDDKKSKAWVYALIGLFLIGGIWYFVSNSSKNDNVVKDTTTTVESNSITNPSNDTISQSALATDSTALSTASSAQESQTNAEPESSTNENTTKDNNSSVSKTTSKDTVLTNSDNQGTLEEKAKKVIIGVFGNGTDRKRALGNEYAAIQAKVNEIYRNR